MAEQKQPIPPGAWWVRLARPLVRDYEEGFVQLGKELAKKVGRPRPWSHSLLSRFVANGQCSVELAAGISAFFKLPRPAFVARSRNEAIEMEGIASKYDNVSLSEIDAEIVELEERLAELKAKAEEDAQRSIKPAQHTKHLRSG